MIATQCALALDVVSVKGNHRVRDFAHAKQLLTRIYRGHEITIYCGCKVYGKNLNMNQCHASSPNQSSRFKKLEWEHVVDAHRMAGAIRSWTEGDASCGTRRGCKCAERASPLFRQMEADLYNLYPESGGINGARSDKAPVDHLNTSEKIKRFGTCETLIGRRTFQPRPEVRGEIARTYLYMAEAYDLPLTIDEKAMFTRWDLTDPVDDWECERARRIRDVQGNENKFVTKHCPPGGH